MRNRLGLVLNLPERKENRVMEDDELGGIFFFLSSDICFVIMAGSERGALQGGSKLLDSSKKHIHRKLDI